MDAPKFFDVMVDLETTGLQPDNAAIIQIAAVKFDLETRQVDSSNMFNRCLNIPPKRFWDESTRQWWGQQKRSVLEDIYARMEDPRTVVQAFGEWAGYSHEKPLTFWAKPTHFDFSFLQSYFHQFEVTNPFHYRWATDMNSFIRGTVKSNELPALDVPFVGDAHNAIFDVLNQIATVFKAVE